MKSTFPKTVKAIQYFQWGSLVINKGDRIIIEAENEANNLCSARVDKPSGQKINMSCRAIDSMFFLKKIEEVK